MTRVINIHTGEPYDVRIMRPSKWGNPFSHRPSKYPVIRVRTRQEAIDKYLEMILDRPDLLDALHELKGKVLGCCCKPLPCHGDLLAELADLL